MKKVILKEDSFSQEMSIFETTLFEKEAEIALRLVEHFGVIAAFPLETDKGDRQQCRLLTPDEVVDRSFDIAHAFMKRANKDGLVYELPEPDDLRAVKKAERKERRAKLNQETSTSTSDTTKGSTE